MCTPRAVPGRAGQLFLLCCLSCTSHLNPQRGMGPDHSTLLSSPSRDKYPACIPPQSCRDLEAPHSHGQRELPILLLQRATGWAPHELLPPPLVLQGPEHAVVAYITGQWVAQLAQEGDMAWTTLAGGWESPRQGGRGYLRGQKVTASVADSPL